jgi:Zn-dependent protease
MFRKAYRLPFRLLGIPLDLDITFLLVLPLFAWIIANNIPAYIETFGLQIDPKALQEVIHPFFLGLAAAVGLFVSVVIHELGHCVVGRYFGMKITSITLWLLGGMAQFKEISKRPGVEALMAIAGPLTSYALGGLCWLALSATPSALPALQFVVSYLMWMNVILATFNLLPALPLDGGRVLRSLLALRMSHVDATQTAVSVSRFFAFLLGLVGFVSFNVFMLLVAFFVFMAGTSESQLATVSAMLQGIRVRDVMTRAVKTVPPEMRVSALLEKMFAEKHLAYPVLNEAGNTVGIVTLRELQHPGETGDGTLNVGAVMTDVGTIEPDDSAFDAFMKISQHPTGRLVVSGPDDKLEGIISKTDLVQAIQLRMVGKALAPKGAAVGG